MLGRFNILSGRPLRVETSLHRVSVEPVVSHHTYLMQGQEGGIVVAVSILKRFIAARPLEGKMRQ